MGWRRAVFVGGRTADNAAADYLIPIAHNCTIGSIGLGYTVVDLQAAALGVPKFLVNHIEFAGFVGNQHLILYLQLIPIYFESEMIGL